jgi:2-amino-4-hydroxy-6-hydroxymethyldihydropteridine diphosphokinase
VIAYVGVGSNIANRLAYLALARSHLGGRPSPIYESAAVGGPPQRAYLNGVLELGWEGAPEELLELCLVVEDQAGRERKVRNGPRTLDLDVIAVGNARVRRDGLELPHPRALQRAFVVRPLLDLGPRGIPISTEAILRANRDTRTQRCSLVGPWPSPL